MRIHGFLGRALVVLAVLVGGLLGTLGGLALGAPGLIAAGLAGGLVGLATAGVPRETPGYDRRATAERVVVAAGLTAAAVLVVAGLATVAGGALTALGVGGVVGTGVVLRLARSWRDDGAARVLSPVARLTTAALGREWLRTTSALAGRLDAGTRRAIVDRRHATLDELERRDPDGFRRWLAAGPAPGSDPAAYVRSGPVADTDAA